MKTSIIWCLSLSVSLDIKKTWKQYWTVFFINLSNLIIGTLMTLMSVSNDVEIYQIKKNYKECPQF